MTTFYMDTSAVAKRYITEIGSAWIQAITDPVAGNQILVCDLTPIEFASILARRLREGRMTSPDIMRVEANYQFHHTHEYWVSQLSDDIMTLARQLLYRQTLRALDSIHLACALETARTTGIQPTFVS
jgi:uncharacterized protein